MLETHSILTAIADRNFDGVLGDSTHRSDITHHLKRRINEASPFTFHDIPESRVLGRALPDWIHPLHFETNLDRALTYLRQAEELEAALEQLQFQRIQRAFFRSSVENTGPSDDFQRQDDALDFDGREESLRLRLAYALIDLLSYTAAAKLGARTLYGFEIVAPDDDVAGSLSKIRVGLRALFDVFRAKNARRTESSVSVSLRWGGVTDLKHWKHKSPTSKNDYAKGTRCLVEPRLEFDLRSFAKLHVLKDPRIVTVGLRVDDLRTNHNLVSTDKHYLNRYSLIRWGFRLENLDDDIFVGGQNTGLRHTVADTVFTNVPAVRSMDAISWADNFSLLNVSPCRQWRLVVDEEGHNGQNFKNVITEIEVVFRVSHEL